MDAGELYDALGELREKLAKPFLEEIQKKSNDDLNTNIINLSKRLQDLEIERSNDEKLKTARANLNALNGAWKDTKAEVANQLSFIILTLKERGEA